MATKTSKRAGETSTTVSVGIRIDPKIKFALDIMGRLQKRSLTAVIEWSISQAIAQQAVDYDGTSLALALDKIWSTDESVRLVNMALHMPEALTYDELRIWETIKASSCFWRPYADLTFSTEPDRLVMFMITDNWDYINTHVKRHSMNPTIVPIKEDDLIPF